MKKIIDHAADITGWTIDIPSEVAINSHRDYIAGLNATSIICSIEPSVSGVIVRKDFDEVDLAGYDTLVLSLGSFNYGKNDYEDHSFSYKIRINDTDEYYLPINKTFNDINIALDGALTLDRIEITSLHGGSDYLWISEILLEKEEVALDMMDSVVEHISQEISNAVGQGISLGAITSSAGSKSIDLPDADYKEQYAVISITDGVNSETHQVDDIDELGKVTFMSTYDGRTLKYSYTSASVYLIFPVEINPDERNVKIPGITVWGFSPEPIYRTGKLDTVIQAYRIDGSFIQTTEGQLLNMPIQIDCEARQMSLLNICAKAVRRWLENEKVWVNGRFHELEWTEAAVESLPQTGIDIIPKVQYNLNIETQEMFGEREEVSPAGESEITVSIRR